ncbi:TPM domain-containing protein [Salibacteraceae bacterium]|nr:TPM domain-containing protein [Salibacteraceae bacterium]
MERMIKSFSTIALALLVSLESFALEVPPTPNRLVNDYAGVLGSSNANRLESKLRSYMDTTSTQIAVVTISSLEGDDLFDFSQRLAEKWEIGGGENDNGVLLLVSVNDRAIRIHTGYGTEGAIPDAIAKRIIENEVKPPFRDGDYFSGIDQATNAMIQALSGEYKGSPQQKGRGPASFIPFVIILIIFLIGGWRRRYTGYSSRGRGYYGSPFIGGFGGGSSGGGGGGFGGFGGGGFGGGGASGGW